MRPGAQAQGVQEREAGHHGGEPHAPQNPVRHLVDAPQEVPVAGRREEQGQALREQQEPQADPQVRKVQSLLPARPGGWPGLRIGTFDRARRFCLLSCPPRVKGGVSRAASLRDVWEGTALRGVVGGRRQEVFLRGR